MHLQIPKRRGEKNVPCQRTYFRKKKLRAVGDKRTVSKVLWEINHKHHLEAADLIHSIPITINLTGI